MHPTQQQIETCFRTEQFEANIRVVAKWYRDLRTGRVPASRNPYGIPSENMFVCLHKRAVEALSF